jgi:rhamnose utilization protein RhaD (predicted bifunctional aldolase and dehydrogenase)/NAD(P)-dependent dehydrogenase (short-subunit alcohol dehydrogenase family)
MFSSMRLSLNVDRADFAAMKNLWSDGDALAFGTDALGQRVYSSRLLGRDSSLVLHGGGNTSVKASATDPLGRTHDVLYVKGSGWDLATIERAGFAPVRLSVLREIAELPSISDPDLVRAQRLALTDPGAPDPSVEAVLHAIIPAPFVDHTHADALVAMTNTPRGAEDVRAVFGDRVIVVPYVMPGFALARAVYELARNLDWSEYDGMILLHHGVFTWGDTARASYDAMIDLVAKAESFLQSKGATTQTKIPVPEDLRTLSRIRRAVSRAAGRAMIAVVDRTNEANGFASMSDVASIATRGPLTPDHVIRTKPIPVVFGKDPVADVGRFGAEYCAYFKRRDAKTKQMLDVAPRWAVWPGHGTIAFGATLSAAAIVRDINQHTIAAIQWAEALGGWRALPESDLFDVEYWDLEQAKLAKGGAGKTFDGRVAIVTGAAGGIGRAIARELSAQGAAVVTVDIAPSDHAFHVVADVTAAGIAANVVDEAVRRFGGLDILVSSVGVFPPSQAIESLDDDAWDRAIDVNLTSHERMLKAAVPYLKEGIDAAVVFVGSKNVPAPGPGQAAYSVSKAGLTQLARVAALELGRDGIRVNVVHPNAVFDTGFWTEEVLQARAAAYGKSVEEYKRSNVLGVEVTSKHVAAVVTALAGPAFACTTGAQIPIDGGNERVI